METVHLGNNQFYATRHSAREIRDAAMMLLDEQNNQITLDFANVEAITTAFADELVVTLIRRYGDRILLANTSRAVVESIEFAMYRRNLDVQEGQ